MQTLLIPSKEERLVLAEQIVELSSAVLSKKENQRYLALQVGTPPYCNAVALAWSKDRVSFYIRSTDLVNQAILEGFKPEPAKSAAVLSKHKYDFYGLKTVDLRKHEDLFRAIVKESVDFILSQRPKAK
ncbi:MAG: hypothetical protein ACLPM3_01410 [Terracidiphilus sp.]